MEPPPPQPSVAGFAAQSSRKRVLPDIGSTLMDSDVTEIPASVFLTSRSSKQKQVLYQEVIDVDDEDEDLSTDVTVPDEKIDSKNKGKAVENGYDGSIGHQMKESSESPPPGSHESVNLELYDDDYDAFTEDYIDIEELEGLQSYFDHANIPTGVEAQIPWSANAASSEKLMSNAINSYPYPAGSGLQNKGNLIPGLMDTSSDVSLQQASADSQPVGGNAMDVKSSKSWGTGIQKQAFLASVSPFTYFDNASIFNGVGPQAPNSASSENMMSNGSNPYTFPSSSLQHKGNSPQHPFMNSSSLQHKGNFPQHPFMLSSDFSPQQAAADIHFGGDPTNVKLSKSWWTGPFTKLKKPYAHKFLGATKFWPESGSGSSVNFQNIHDLLDTTMDLPAEEGADTPGGQDKPSVDVADLLRKFELFKQFDTVEDHSDHFFASRSSSAKQPSKNWVKKIQEEWKILEKDLPDNIYVRVYESRMDLLRAVIVGAEGTPYHDGLFFFDVSFPSNYPSVPPLVHYYSGGLRLNPNLYSCGKVCLSLLNTWSGGKNEKWLPRVSTMLQVLVSIQALILNQKPYFNEPGYACMDGTPNGEIQSLKYNENTFTLSLRTMLYTMRRPPKHFEDLVAGHFHTRAHDILIACKAYMAGAQVGCLVKGGVQDVDEGDKSCSQHFKDSLPGYVNMLVKEFTKLGVQDCEKFVTDPKKEIPKVNNHGRGGGIPLDPSMFMI